jgi:hypothetical protein
MKFKSACKEPFNLGGKLEEFVLSNASWANIDEAVWALYRPMLSSQLTDV